MIPETSSFALRRILQQKGLVPVAQCTLQSVAEEFDRSSSRVVESGIECRYLLGFAGQDGRLDVEDRGGVALLSRAD